MPMAARPIRVFAFRDTNSGEITIEEGPQKIDAWRALASQAADGDVNVARELFEEVSDLPAEVYYLTYTDIKNHRQTLGPMTYAQMVESKKAHESNQEIGINKNVSLQVMKVPVAKP
jgi:hypothetical protein